MTLSLDLRGLTMEERAKVKVNRMDKYKHLILVEVDESPFLVLADDAPPEDGFVAFHDGQGMRMGEVVKSCFIGECSDEYSMFSMLYPIFDAVKMYGCCYEKEVRDG